MPAHLIAEASKAATKTRTSGKKHAIGAQPKVEGGISIAGRREARRRHGPIVVERSGAVSNLRRQVRIGLEVRDGLINASTGKAMSYVADSVYHDAAAGIEVIEDTRGYRTDTCLIIRAILAAMELEVRET